MTKTKKIAKRVDGSQNSLDGLTILRFSHIYDSGGGIEQYIDDLDSMLLNRNMLNIVRIYLSKDIHSTKEQIEKIGQEKYRGRTSKYKLIVDGR